MNDTEINGLAAAVSAVLTAKGFTGGNVGNNEGEKPPASQVLAAKVDDLGAQAVAEELGGLPVVADDSAAGTVRVVLATITPAPAPASRAPHPTVRWSTMPPPPSTAMDGPPRRRRRSSRPAPTIPTA